MIQERGGCGSSRSIHHQARRQELLQQGAVLLRLAERRCVARGDQIQRAHGLHVHVWRLRLGHLNRHDAQRPDVDLVSVALLLDYLRGHPVRGADQRVAL